MFYDVRRRLCRFVWRLIDHSFHLINTTPSMMLIQMFFQKKEGQEALLSATKSTTYWYMSKNFYGLWSMGSVFARINEYELNRISLQRTLLSYFTYLTETNFNPITQRLRFKINHQVSSSSSKSSSSSPSVTSNENLEQ